MGIGVVFRRRRNIRVKFFVDLWGIMFGWFGDVFRFFEDRVRCCGVLFRVDFCLGGDELFVC